MEKLYINKEDCCGCSACLNICPKHAIYMKHDEKDICILKLEKIHALIADYAKRFVH